MSHVHETLLQSSVHTDLGWGEQLQWVWNIIYLTTNVTSRHRGPKWKLRAGYRTLSLQRTSYLCVALLCCKRYIFHRLCVYSKFGHRPHPLGYLCAKFRFLRGLHCWVSPRRKIAYSINQTLTQLIWCPGDRSFCFGKHRNIYKDLVQLLSKAKVVSLLRIRLYVLEKVEATDERELETSEYKPRQRVELCWTCTGRSTVERLVRLWELIQFGSVWLICGWVWCHYLPTANN